MTNIHDKAKLIESMAIAFHESQFNNGKYGMPWEKVSKESKARYMLGMSAAIDAMREAGYELVKLDVDEIAGVIFNNENAVIGGWEGKVTLCQGIAQAVIDHLKGGA